MVRDKKGKFVKGHPGGPGRPKKSREDRFYEILVTTVTEQDWREIIQKAVVEAKRGDTSARTWLSNYYAGPPVQKLEHTGAEGGPVKIKVVLQDDA